MSDMRAGLRVKGPAHYETLDGRFDLHRLERNGPVYIYDNQDESAGLDPLDHFPSWPQAADKVRELVNYVRRSTPWT